GVAEEGLDDVRSPRPRLGEGLGLFDVGSDLWHGSEPTFTHRHHLTHSAEFGGDERGRGGYLRRCTPRTASPTTAPVRAAHHPSSSCTPVSPTGGCGTRSGRTSPNVATPSGSTCAGTATPPPLLP